uniref:Uncharacterized protein n=1 Tax=Solanum lycopersicum TaxID=4081 RepID=A0A3Q7J099_SOLLC
MVAIETGLSNGHSEIDSSEREEGIPFDGRDWRLGQSEMFRQLQFLERWKEFWKTLELLTAIDIQ